MVNIQMGQIVWHVRQVINVPLQRVGEWNVLMGSTKFLQVRIVESRYSYCINIRYIYITILFGSYIK